MIHRATILTRAVLGVIATACLGTCSGEPAPEPTPSALSSTAQREGASLTASADVLELRTVDLLTVVLEAVAPRGMVVRSVELDTESAGWEIVSRPEAVLTVDRSGRSVHTERLVLEPFLDGEYTVPPVIASFAVPGAPGSIELSTTPISIMVSSVLAEDAAIDVLSPFGGPVEPAVVVSSSPAPGFTVWIGTGVVLSVLALFVVIRSRASRETEPDPERELHLLRLHPSTDPEIDRDRLASILRRVVLAQPHPALESILNQVDADRYAPPGRSPSGSVDVEIEAALHELGGAS